MRIIFYLGHPAHYHLFKRVISRLAQNNHSTHILIKKKDILEDLVSGAGWSCENILPNGRKDNLVSIGWGQFVRDWALFQIARRYKPDLMIGTCADIAHVGRLLKIPSIVVNEDDYDAVPLFSISAYPFAEHILTPFSCNVGKWAYKNISYDGYHELAYLHPQYFSPDEDRVGFFARARRNFILRFARLNAHHDNGKTGINSEIAANLIKLLAPYGNIYITAERPLEPEFERYRIQIDPLHIHHALYYADLYIGDSQTMAAEAAVLGTPSVRFNDFVGKLGYLEELEHKYGLTCGIKTSEPEKLYSKIAELLDTPDLRQEWQKRRRRMLAEKIDVTAMMVWFIENYPESVAVMRENPDYQYNFRDDCSFIAPAPLGL